MNSKLTSAINYNSNKELKLTVSIKILMDSIKLDKELKTFIDSIKLNEKFTKRNIIKAQSLWRGYYLRKYNIKIDDKYTYLILNQCIDKYLSDLKFNDEINSHMSQKKRRNENFPSDISENITKLVIAKKYRIMPCWDTKKGDLIIHKKNIPFYQIEVKGFISNGPASFGPKEEWDWLYFVDGRQIRDKIFKVYEVKLSNRSTDFRNIRISKVKTFGEQADTGKRPRANFDDIFKKQLGNKCKLIFHGHISELYNLV